MIGKIFDNTTGYLQNSAEIKKLLNYYFNKEEIKNKVILDAGCRVGDYSQALIEMGAEKVFGIDLSHECIKAAKKKYHANKKIEFYQGDISNLKMFKDSFFDVVFCIGTISYLKPIKVKKTLKEFYRVTRQGGLIIVLFQKNKGLIVKVARLIANILPLKIYLFLIENFAFLIKPFIEKMVGRKITLNYLKYDILLSLRGIHFGIPIKINKRFRVKTIKCEQCSEETTASYKIKVF